MKLAALFSGGKDSCLALFKALESGHEIKYLLSIYPENVDSFFFHKPNKDLLIKQAKELGIKLIIKQSAGKKEEELKDLEKLIEAIRREIEGIVVGGLASNYQRKRIKSIAKKFKLRVLLPLWGYSAEKLWEELLTNNFKIILTKISCEGLPSTFLGKIINKKIFEKIKKLSENYKFRIDFEGGEAETAVLYMPYFKNKIRVKGKIRSEGTYRHFLEINKVF